MEPAADFSPADIAWVLTCSALAVMMTAPGSALFYWLASVHKKNVLQRDDAMRFPDGIDDLGVVDLGGTAWLSVGRVPGLEILIVCFCAESSPLIT